VRKEEDPERVVAGKPWEGSISKGASR